MTGQGFVQFRDDTRIPYLVPANTLDPRWKACTDHSVACDCREAERQEEWAELRAQLREVALGAAEILDGHDTHGDEGSPCMCSGCQIVRRGDLSARWMKADFVGPMDRPAGGR